MGDDAWSDAHAYVAALRDERKAKDQGFAGHHSPLEPAERARFKGLAYFDPDPEARVQARFEPHAEPASVVIDTSDGAQRQYLKIGRLAFTLHGTEGALEALWSEGAESLFIPFKDATSARETYGAGRYLDVPWRGPDHGYVLDFNRAYNPFCAYSDHYSCPFPPPENWLTFPVNAGEKTFDRGAGA